MFSTIAADLTNPWGALLAVASLVVTMVDWKQPVEKVIVTHVASPAPGGPLTTITSVTDTITTFNIASNQSAGAWDILFSAPVLSLFALWSLVFVSALFFASFDEDTTTTTASTTTITVLKTIYEQEPTPSTIATATTSTSTQTTPLATTTTKTPEEADLLLRRCQKAEHTLILADNEVRRLQPIERNLFAAEEEIMRLRREIERLSAPQIDEQHRDRLRRERALARNNRQAPSSRGVVPTGAAAEFEFRANPAGSAEARMRERLRAANAAIEGAGAGKGGRRELFSGVLQIPRQG